MQILKCHLPTTYDQIWLLNLFLLYWSRISGVILFLTSEKVAPEFKKRIFYTQHCYNLAVGWGKVENLFAIQI